MTGSAISRTVMTSTNVPVISHSRFTGRFRTAGAVQKVACLAPGSSLAR